MLVYGLLAVCTVLVLAARPSDESADMAELSGRTSHRESIALWVDDGRLHGAQARAWAWCPDPGRWFYWTWAPSPSTPGIEFSQDGSRFFVRDRKSTIPRFSSSVRLELRGRMAADGMSARGTLDVWVRARGRRPPCTSQAQFRLTR